MKIFQKIHSFYKGQGKYFVTLVLLVLAASSGFYAYYHAKTHAKIIYAESLDTKAVQVNDTILTLRDMAFYVAYEEALVESQAEIYSPEDTNQYWNAHDKGGFVRVAARDAAIQMAVHDEIFYQMAVEAGIELSSEEEAYLLNSQMDFWYDLTDEGKEERLGIDMEQIDISMRKACIAKKYQNIYAAMNDRNTEEYDISEEGYEELLEENSYKIYEEVWERITFGNVTLEH